MNLEQAEKRLIFKGLTGSRAYGLHTDSSDYDYRGVFAVPSATYLRLHEKVNQVSDDKNDVTYYTLLRFLELVVSGNPNILELLWLPEDCIVQVSPAWRVICEHREEFITRKALWSYVGYAVAQIKRAVGRNRRVNNPMPEERPRREDFCYYIPFVAQKCISSQEFDPETGTEIANYSEVFRYIMQPPINAEQEFPVRPKKWTETVQNSTFDSEGNALVQYHTLEDLNDYVVASLEHVPNVYRLYYDDKKRGVFRNGQLVCESIAKEDEWSRFRGLLIYNDNDYQRELKQWKQYWEWKKNRNEDRWQDGGDEVAFDRKNMQHTIRLLLEGEHILKYGHPAVRFDPYTLDYLRSIRSGDIPYEQLIDFAENKREDLDAAIKTSTLRKSVDLDKISNLSEIMHEAMDLTFYVRGE